MQIRKTENVRMKSINAFKQIEGIHMCRYAPLQQGSKLRYPWEVMAPGSMFIVRDSNLEAGNALYSSAAKAGRRLGRKFITGKFMDDRDPSEVIHVGYWCARVDGLPSN